MPISYLTTATKKNGTPIFWSLFVGEAVPIKYTFPAEVDLSGDSFYVEVCDTVFPMTVEGNTIECLIPSSFTKDMPIDTHILNVWHIMSGVIADDNTNKQVIISGTMNVR